MTKDEWISILYNVLRKPEKIGNKEFRISLKSAMKFAEEIAEELEQDFKDGAIDSLPWNELDTKDSN